MDLYGRDQFYRVATLLRYFCSADEAHPFLSAVLVVEKSPRKWRWKKWPSPVDVKTTGGIINFFVFPSNKKGGQCPPALLQNQFLESVHFYHNQFCGFGIDLAIKGFFRKSIVSHR